VDGNAVGFETVVTVLTEVSGHCQQLNIQFKKELNTFARSSAHITNQGRLVIAQMTI